mmetsp:Transcript_22421/g.39491  ORF Transcript_22421/g.39491 Transcript_22421/m.39491 type:complete len:261 (+) Transcript_22421:1535-2317(+)
MPVSPSSTPTRHDPQQHHNDRRLRIVSEMPASLSPTPTNPNETKMKTRPPSPEAPPMSSLKTLSEAAARGTDRTRRSFRFVGAPPPPREARRRPRSLLILLMIAATRRRRSPRAVASRPRVVLTNNSSKIISSRNSLTDSHSGVPSTYAKCNGPIPRANPENIQVKSMIVSFLMATEPWIIMAMMARRRRVNGRMDVIVIARAVVARAEALGRVPSQEKMGDREVGVVVPVVDSVRPLDRGSSFRNNSSQCQLLHKILMG